MDVSFERAPKIYEWGGYESPKFDGKGGGYHGLQGPDTMKIMRKRLVDLGVTILDHSPALELLVDDGGAVAGARGIRRQQDKTWTVKAGATVLASGGCAWLSKSMGCNNNTGDGLLMTVEAGGELSGMEFSSHYHQTTANSSCTKGGPNYPYANFYDEAGNEIEGCFKGGHAHTSVMAKALLKGKVFVQLNKPGTENLDVQRRLRMAQPNFWAVYDKQGIDPFKEKFELTLSLEGTVRGTGGIRIVDEDCGTTVPGLYAAGDAATRQLHCGAFTGGAGPNMSWAIASGHISGLGATKYARSLGKHVNTRTVRGVGGAGLKATVETTETFKPNEIVKAIQEEVFPYDKFMFRTEEGILNSLAKLEKLWKAVQVNPDQSTPQMIQRSREAVAMLAAARWSYFAGLERKETRGIQRRLDYPKMDPNQRHYLSIGGLDKMWIRPEPIPEEVVPEPAHLKEAVHA